MDPYITSTDLGFCILSSFGGQPNLAFLLGQGVACSYEYWPVGITALHFDSFTYLWSQSFEEVSITAAEPQYYSVPYSPWPLLLSHLLPYSHFSIPQTIFDQNQWKTWIRLNSSDWGWWLAGIELTVVKGKMDFHLILCVLLMLCAVRTAVHTSAVWTDKCSEEGELQKCRRTSLHQILVCIVSPAILPLCFTREKFWEKKSCSVQGQAQQCKQVTRTRHGQWCDTPGSFSQQRKEHTVLIFHGWKQNVGMVVCLWTKETSIT